MRNLLKNKKLSIGFLILTISFILTILTLFTITAKADTIWYNEPNPDINTGQTSSTYGGSGWLKINGQQIGYINSNGSSYSRNLTFSINSTSTLNWSVGAYSTTRYNGTIQLSHTVNLLNATEIRTSVTDGEGDYSVKGEWIFRETGYYDSTVYANTSNLYTSSYNIMIPANCHKIGYNLIGPGGNGGSGGFGSYGYGFFFGGGGGGGGSGYTSTGYSSVNPGDVISVTIDSSKTQLGNFDIAYKGQDGEIGGDADWGIQSQHGMGGDGGLGGIKGGNGGGRNNVIGLGYPGKGAKGYYSDNGSWVDLVYGLGGNGGRGGYTYPDQGVPTYYFNPLFMSTEGTWYWFNRPPGENGTLGAAYVTFFYDNQTNIPSSTTGNNTSVYNPPWVPGNYTNITYLNNSNSTFTTNFFNYTIYNGTNNTTIFFYNYSYYIDNSTNYTFYNQAFVNNTTYLYSTSIYENNTTNYSNYYNSSNYTDVFNYFNNSTTVFNNYTNVYNNTTNNYFFNYTNITNFYNNFEETLNNTSNTVLNTYNFFTNTTDESDAAFENSPWVDAINNTENNLNTIPLAICEFIASIFTIPAAGINLVNSTFNSASIDFVKIADFASPFTYFWGNLNIKLKATYFLDVCAFLIVLYLRR